MQQKKSVLKNKKNVAIYNIMKFFKTGILRKKNGNTHWEEHWGDQ